MANGADPAYDIFVSYAHVDDEPLPGIEQGWVRTFVAAFKTYLAKELGRRESVRLWMDCELRGNEPLTQAIHERLQSVKVLVPFLSKGYLASGWCMDELQTFHARPGTGKRIFPVYVSPVEEVPDALRDLPLDKYCFWQADDTGENRTLGDPFPSPAHDRDYYQGLRRLARDLARTLAGIPAAEPGIGGRRVFVSGATDDLELVRTTAQDLNGQGLDCYLPLSATSGFDPLTDPVDLRRDLENGLTESSAVVLLFRDGPLSQLRQTIREVQKLRARSDQVPGRIDLC